MQLATIQALCRYWGNDYDWRRCQAKLNACPSTEGERAAATALKTLRASGFADRHRGGGGEVLLGGGASHGGTAGQAPPGVKVRSDSPSSPARSSGPWHSWVEQAHPNVTYFNEVDEERSLRRLGGFTTEIRAAFRTLR